MLGELMLEEVGPSPRLSFSFGPRLNLLTGDNGLGKSFVLDLAWWALTRNADPVPALPRTGGQGVVSASLVAEDGHRTEFQRIHNDLYRLLKDTDPFWARWLARAEAAGIEP